MVKARRARLNNQNVIANPAGAKQSLRLWIASSAFSLLAMTALFFSGPVLACPMCTELLEHGADAAKAWRFGLGIGWSILLMLAVPFLIVGSLLAVILRAQKRRAREMSDGIQNERSASAP